MGLILDNKGISSMTFNGKKVKECWLNGEKIWPKYTTVLDTITEISKSHDASSQPIHVALLDGNLDQSPIINGNSSYMPKSFNGSSGVGYGEGLEGPGRKALSCFKTYINMSESVKTRLFTLSVCVKQKTTSTYNGFVGGVIFGLNTKGYGYAIGSGTAIQNNKLCFEIYGTINSALALYTEPINDGKWHHVLIQCSTLAGINMMQVNIDGGQDYTLTGAIGDNLDFSDLSDTGTTSMRLGATYQSDWNYWKGYIQDLIILPHALTTEEKNLLMNYYKQYL